MEAKMEIPERDGDGYLKDMNQWTPEIGRAMAEADGYTLDDDKWEQILKAREYYDDVASVPPIRKFAKYLGRDQKELFDIWMTGPMKPITKYGGLPKPTGCV
jgi:tRNA 2-thiouridine synthesizing protein E